MGMTAVFGREKLLNRDSVRGKGHVLFVREISVSLFCFSG